VADLRSGIEHHEPQSTLLEVKGDRQAGLPPADHDDVVRG